MADITLHVINKDTKALDYLTALANKAKVFDKPILMQVKAEGLDKVTKDALNYARTMKEIELVDKKIELASAESPQAPLL